MKMLMPSTARGSDISIRLRKYLKEGKPLFVRNQTQPRQVIFLSWMPEGSTTRSSENIANTYLPIEITRHISHTDLLRSEDFWAMIEAGALVPVSQKVAKEQLASEDAVYERQRLKTQGGATARSVGRTINFNNVPNGLIPQDTQAAPGDDDGPAEPKINNRVLSVVGRLGNPDDGGIMPGAALAELKNITGLTRTDYAYIVGNGTYVDQKDNVDTRVSDWAMTQMGKKKQEKESKPKAKKPKTGRVKVGQAIY